MRVKVTSNIKKFERAFKDNATKAMREVTDKEVKQFLLSLFSVVLSNTPVDTGTLMMNWHVYKHGGMRSLYNVSPYPRHGRYDMEGRLSRHAMLMPSQLALLRAELENLNLEFFQEGRSQVTIGISNPVPYGVKLDQGLYFAKPPYVNLTPDGFSVQAPSGIMQVSINAIERQASGLGMMRYIKTGGNS